MSFKQDWANSVIICELFIVHWLDSGIVSPKLSRPNCGSSSLYTRVIDRLKTRSVIHPRAQIKCGKRSSLDVLLAKLALAPFSTPSGEDQFFQRHALSAICCAQDSDKFANFLVTRCRCSNRHFMETQDGHEGYGKLIGISWVSIFNLLTAREMTYRKLKFYFCL